MSKKVFVEDDKGNITHVREVSSDGRTSWLYKADTSVGGQLLRGGKGELVEVDDHHKDGTTTAYEADNSLLGSLSGSKGKRK